MENCNVGILTGVEGDENLTLEELEIEREKDRVIAEQIWHNESLNDICGEVWSPIVGYEEMYNVSNKGRIKSLARVTIRHFDNIGFPSNRDNQDKIKTLILSDYGYLHIDLSRGNKREGFQIHRLVAKAFISNLENKSDVNHLRGVKIDNRIERLEWSTSSENEKHAYRTGLKSNLGLRNSRCKLKEEDILKIRERAILETYVNVAKDYGITFGQVGHIVKRRTWSHIK